MRAALFNVDGWMWRGRVSCISGRASATHRHKMQARTFNDDACGVGGGGYVVIRTSATRRHEMWEMMMLK